jgi:hypothetical protein
MIEAYAFLAMFTVQILAMSVLQPARFIRYCRMQATSIPAERLAQLFPGVDVRLAQERFLTRYRALAIGVAVLGLLLLSWLFSYTRRPDWDESSVVMLVAVYFGVQILPLLLVAWLGVRFNKVHKRSLLEGKRKATLQRRGLFDFISPFVVFLAVLGYFLFAAVVIYVQQHPSAFVGPVKPFLGPALLGAVTLVYALEAFVVYRMLYGKKSNPFETHAGRVHTIGRAVKSCIYGCIACVVYLAVTFTLAVLDLDRWQPFALSASLVTSALLSIMGLTAPPREPAADGLDSSPIL